jgi:serine/threonine-protein kinase
VFPQIFGKYVLERELASGGMARVYLATLRGAVGFEKRLVVKQIRPELASDQAFVRRFVEEAKTTVDLSHPNIVPVYELGVEQGVYYIAMELCAGVTLAEILRHTGALSPEEGAYLGVEICRALDYAHRRAGIVHRDVTPRNVLIDEEGAVRLIDFGIAAPAADSGLRRAEIFGSPGHMPPEQLAGKELSPATDVFAVAVLLFEAWTGKPVFRRATSKASQAALSEPVGALSEVVPALEPLSELIGRGLALEPTVRPAQAELFARPLRDFLRNVDAGDVARRLGARVRRAERRANRSEPPSRPSSPLLQSTPALGEPAVAFESSGASEPTYTFAARHEVASWTRKLGSERGSSPSSAPPSPSSAPRAELGTHGPSTRKLPSQPPPALESGPPSSAPISPRVAETSRVAEPSSARAVSERRRGAAQPSPVPDAPPATTSGPPATPSSGSLRVFVVGVAIAAGITLFIGLSRAPRAPTTSARLATTASRAGEAPLAPTPRAITSGETAVNAAARDVPPDASASPKMPQNAAASSTVSHLAGTTPAPVSHQPPAPLDTPPPSGSDALRPPPSSSANVTAGVLRITADPAAGVSLQGPSGARALTTPVRDLKLPPGVYVLTFRSQTYPEPVVARVALPAGESRSVHVDFRDVEPRVIVR